MSNSLATTHRMWDAQMAAFTTQYRVLRYDKRGHGETDVTPGPYSFELLADDVLALLDALQIARTHFVGLSMGGMTGMTMALRKPGVLRTLVLCDTTSRDPLGDPALWQQRIDAVNAGGQHGAPRREHGGAVPHRRHREERGRRLPTPFAPWCARLRWRATPAAVRRSPSST